MEISKGMAISDPAFKHLFLQFIGSRWIAAVKGGESIAQVTAKYYLETPYAPTPPERK